MFENYDFEYLMEEMLSEVSDDLDKREGSIIYDALAPVALQYANIFAALDMVMNETSAYTASYYYLIQKAAERGLTPKEETYAVCKMVATPATAKISVGDRFNLGDLNYSVAGEIEGEAGSYKVECETAGTVGNQQLGELLPIEYVEGLETAELTEILIPGEEEEDVESFRERYFASFESNAFGGNKDDYLQKVNEIDGVGGCKIERAWINAEYSPSNMTPDETVQEWFATQSKETLGEGVYNWLKTVYSAALNKLLTTGGTVQITLINSDYQKPSEVLINTVQSMLDPTGGEGDGIAPIGHVVNVKGVEEQTVDISTNLTFKNGYTFEDLKESINEAIDGYLLLLAQDWADSEELVVRISRIENLLLDIEGVLDISGTTINGLEENLIVDGDFIPVRGEISG